MPLREKQGWVARFLTWLGLAAWAGIILVPLAWLLVTLRWTDLPKGEDFSLPRYLELLTRSCATAAAVATISVIAGFPAGRIVGASAWGRTWGPILLILPLLIPPQVIYYAWGLLLLPTSWLGMALSRSDSVIKLVMLVRSTAAMVLWYWPLCGLILGLGWLRTDPEVWSAVKLDAGPWARWRWVGLPVLRTAIVFSWLLVFTMVLSQFTVFHLAGIDTVGTELSTLYQLTGNVHSIAWAALPLIIPALITAVILNRFLQPATPTFDLPANERCGRGNWILTSSLWVLTTVLPFLLLACKIESLNTFIQSAQLSWEGLLYSVGIALGTAVLVILLSLGISLQPGKGISAAMRVMVFIAAMLPGSLVAVAMVYTFNRGFLTRWVYNQPWMISFGHAAQFGILGVLILSWIQASRTTQLKELATLDGAEGWSAAIHIWLPGLWPGILAAVLLILTISITELSATLVLLPAGVPNFAQQLLNQMHYARDQQVIASCLLLILFSAVVAGLVFGLAGLAKKRSAAIGLLVICCLAGCERPLADAPNVVAFFGTTGRGETQFIYPRGMTLAPDGTLFIVDKTAKIRHLTPEGNFLGGWTMPEFQVGKPIGLHFGPDKRVYVADTHYHRVMVYTPDGNLIKQFGSYGTGPGQFIYPTDVQIVPDGRIFVSEYGGNDRINIFSAEGKFLKSFGSLGDRTNQFSRPQAMCLDRGRKMLYVADACNHRISCYDLEGKFLSSFGSIGKLPGQLQYPYDINLMPDGTLLVCEYGNNRVQRFSPEGKSLGVWGQAGKEPGQVLYPWSAGVDSDGRVVVVDSGNNRIQVWKVL
jgi:ABC-type Fe3+ transport system permease subunit/DNA-binding beta-propeller fold protein YncE